MHLLKSMSADMLTEIIICPLATKQFTIDVPRSWETLDVSIGQKVMKFDSTYRPCFVLFQMILGRQSWTWCLFCVALHVGPLIVLPSEPLLKWKKSALAD